MSLYQAFVQELSKITRGYERLNCVVFDEPKQTVVMEKVRSGSTLSVVFEAGGNVKAVKENGFVGEFTREAKTNVSGLPAQEAIANIIYAMTMVSSSFERHVEAVEAKAVARGKRGPRGLDTI